MKSKCEVWCPYKQGALTIGEIKDYLKQRIKKCEEDYKHTHDEKLREYLEGKKPKIVERIDREVVSASCDWCGKPFGRAEVTCRGYGEVLVDFGYGSTMDGDKFVAEICDECFKKRLRKIMRVSKENA